jgi:hypothetical protein
MDEMQMNQDILETQVANICDSICRRLHALAADLERLPYVVQENMDSQRLYNFYENLLTEDRSKDQMEITRTNAAQNLADVFKSAELPPGQDARTVLRDMFNKHEIKPSQPTPTNTIGPKHE